MPEHRLTTSEGEQKAQIEAPVKELEDRTVHLDLDKLTREHHRLQQKYIQAKHSKAKLGKENTRLKEKYQVFRDKTSEQLRIADSRIVAAEEI